MSDFEIRRQKIIDEMNQIDANPLTQESAERYMELREELLRILPKESTFHRFRRISSQWARQNGFSWCYWTAVIVGPFAAVDQLSFYENYPGIGYFMAAVFLFITIFSAWILTYKD